MLTSVKLCSFKVFGTNFENAFFKSNNKIKKLLDLKTDVSFFTFKVSKIDEKENSLKWDIYINISTDKDDESFCKACKEFHSSFYVNDQYSCNSCKFNSYKKRIKEKERNIKKIYKNKLKNL